MSIYKNINICLSFMLHHIIMTKLKNKIYFNKSCRRNSWMHLVVSKDNLEWTMETSFLVRVLSYSSVHCKDKDKFRFYN